MVTGTVCDGLGRAGIHMGEGHCVIEGLGYDPVPGTLNLEVGPDGRDLVMCFPGQITDTVLSSSVIQPGPFWPVSISSPAGSVDGHVRLNASRIHIECVAPVHLRTVLAVSNDDVVEVVPR